MLSEARYKAKYGKRLKLLIPTEMLQILPTALAKLKAGNRSEIHFCSDCIFISSRKCKSTINNWNLDSNAELAGVNNN